MDTKWLPDVNTTMRLEKAFREGDLEAIESALAVPEDFPNCRIPYMGHCLEYAIAQSPLPFVKMMLDLGADPNYEDDGGYPSLIEALDRDRVDKYEVLELLLTYGANVNQRGLEDYTPLHYAATLDDSDAIKILILHGAYLTPRTRVDDYRTPLEVAQASNRPRAVEVLKEAIGRAKSARRLDHRTPTTPETEGLLSEIDAVFARQQFPGEDGIALRRDEVWRFLQKRRWQEVTLQEVLKEPAVDWNSLSFSLSFKGWLYYLPAFLKLSLDVDGPIDFGDLLLFELERFAEPIATSLRPAQKLAVVHVLEYLAREYEKRGYTMNLAKEALDAYWAYLMDAELGLADRGKAD